jgi:hypothetical protein
MRLWSISPEYLDTKGLLANWREGLLARKVLLGKTTGYRNHPQLIRFKEQNDPISAIDSYLNFIFDESVRRGYRFDFTKIGNLRHEHIMTVTKGQLEYEFSHLMSKLGARDPVRHDRLAGTSDVKANRLFRIIQGEKESWEK